MGYNSVGIISRELQDKVPYQEKLEFGGKVIGFADSTRIIFSSDAIENGYP